MVSRIFQPLLFMLAASTENQLIRQVEYFKAENQMLRKRVSKRVNLAADEKTLLLKLGQAVGAGLRHLISIVSYETFRAWVKKSSADTHVECATETEIAIDCARAARGMNIFGCTEHTVTFRSAS